MTFLHVNLNLFFFYLQLIHTIFFKLPVVCVKNVSLYFILNIVLIYRFIYDVRTVVVVNLNYTCNDIAKWFLLLFVRLYTWISASATNLVHPRVHKLSPGMLLVMAIYPFSMPDGWFMHVYKMWAVSCSAKMIKLHH